jgi:transposase-like protein
MSRPYSSQVRHRALSLVLESQQSVRQVARDIGCSFDTVHRWLREHRQQSTPSSEAATFVPVKVLDNQTPPAEIILPSGITVRLADASPCSLAALVHALATC